MHKFGASALRVTRKIDCRAGLHKVTPLQDYCRNLIWQVSRGDAVVDIRCEGRHYSNCSILELA